MDPILGFTRYWDTVDTLSNICAVAFFICAGVVGFAQLNIAGSKDTMPIFRYGVIVAGLAWLVLLIVDYAEPVQTVAYIANSTGRTYQVNAGDERFCLPGYSYARLSWRVEPPKTVEVLPPDAPRFANAIGKGTWLINVAPSPVSIDVINYDEEDINPNDTAVKTAGVTHLSLKNGQPYRFYSQLPGDRVQVADDIKERRTSLPCNPNAVVDP